MPQIPESAHVFETDFRKKRPNRIFSPVNSGIWISGRPGIYPRRAAEAPAVGSGHARKTRITPAAAMRVPGLIPGTGMTGGGLIQLFLGVAQAAAKLAIPLDHCGPFARRLSS
jgi:hypothetical protein